MTTNTPKKITVAVLFGGRSVEHEISIITGLQLIAALDTTKFHPIPIYIAPDGRWFHSDHLLDKQFYSKLPSSLDSVLEVSLFPKPAVGGLSIMSNPQRHALTFFSKRSPNILPIDVYFPALHGTFGEDGCIQGLFELADVAYVGSNVQAASLGMNKWNCKMLLKSIGIPVLPCFRLFRDEVRRLGAGIEKKIRAETALDSLPLIVKPCNLGSSIGVQIIRDWAQLTPSLANVFQYDDQALLEPMVVDILEINVAVMGGRVPVASVAEEPISKTGLLSYDEKYLRREPGKGTTSVQSSEGMTRMARRINPDLEAALCDTAQIIAMQAYEGLGCMGCARIDFICDKKSKRLYFNEINTLPGSLSYYLWNASSPAVTYTELLTRLINEALQTQASKRQLNRDFGFKALFA